MTVFDQPLEAIAGDLESLAATFLDFIKNRIMLWLTD